MDPDTLAAHVASATRATGDRRPLDALMRRCWPGGDDRLEPAAAPWVLRWGPRRSGVAPLECGCAAGRCGVCN